MEKFKGVYQTTKEGVKIWDKEKKEYVPITEDQNKIRLENIANRVSSIRKPKAEVVKKDARESNPALTNVDLKELTATLKAQIKAELQSEQAPVRETSGTPLNSTDIPLEDLMEKPTYVYAYRAGWSDNGYTSKGKTYLPPYGSAIEFKRMPPEVSTDARGNRVENHRCMAEIWSKKILAYVKGHPMFNVEWFESIDGLKYMDKQSANFRLQAYMQVNALNERQVVMECQAKNIPISNDSQLMKQLLVEHKIADALRFQDNQRLSIVNNNANAQLLREQAAAPLK